MIYRFILFLLLLHIGEAVELPAGASQPTKNSKASAPIKEASKVSILCYHDFSAKYDATEMRIRKEAFEKQMRQIKDAGLNVISMPEFIAWKRGERELPDSNIMITIDDGWRSVYLIAYPILKDLGFPFTVGLYRDFIGSGKLSLKNDMVKEMMNNGMTVSSHSVSHPLPSVIKTKRSENEQDYLTFLKTEIGDSKTALEKRFNTKISTYIYPGGYYTQEMFPVLRSFAYEYAFTVKPGKITRDSKDLQLPRYVILGTTNRVFEYALDFGKAKTPEKPVPKLPHPVKPLPETKISERLPWIGADLSKVKNLDRSSVYMRVSGFGLVKGAFLPKSNKFEWQATRPLRSPSYGVTVQWKLKGSSRYQPPLQWKFYLSHQSSYTNTPRR